MAQPPLSQQIRQLEARARRHAAAPHHAPGRADRRRVGVPRPGARRSSARSTRPAREAQRVDQGLVGRLVIGCVGSATYSLLPALARALREELPGIDVAFRGEMLVPDQVAALLGGDDRPRPAAAAGRRARARAAAAARDRLDRRACRTDTGWPLAVGSASPTSGTRTWSCTRRTDARSCTGWSSRCAATPASAADPARGGGDVDAGDLRGGWSRASRSCRSRWRRSGSRGRRTGRCRRQEPRSSSRRRPGRGS